MTSTVPQISERRLRLSEADRRLLLEALACHFQVQARHRRFEDAEKALNLAFALCRNSTGRRTHFAYWVGKDNWKEHYRTLLNWVKQNAEEKKA